MSRLHWLHNPGPSLWSEYDDDAAFVHPLANRQLRMQSVLVGYLFQRAKRRSIGFKIGNDGLEVSAPSWVAVHEVEAVLTQKADWVLTKLRQARQRQQQRVRWVWHDGAVIDYLGAPLQLRVFPSSAKRASIGTFQPAAASVGATAQLSLAMPMGHSADAVRDTVGRWLRQQAQTLYAQRLDHFAPLLGVTWRQLALSNANGRWGSAKSDGTIRLHWRLVHFPMPVLDYVVAHELSHLRHMNHSPAFWDTVATVVPDYRTLRAQLKRQVLPEWC